MRIHRFFGLVLACGLFTACGDGGSSGNGGGGTTGTTTGGGGTGGCASPADCGTPPECQMATCNNGVCGSGPVADGTASAQQTAGDCKQNVCQAGMVTAANDDSDVPDSTECADASCDAGRVVSTPKAEATACSENGGNVCDGMGACVECVSDTECEDNPENFLCDLRSHACVPPPCMNGVKDGEETDLDCGGPICAKCADGLDCTSSSDCMSNHCDVDVCVAATCDDGIQSLAQLGETDVDCGGNTCPPCATGKGCQIATDCVSAECQMNVCQPNCFDAEKNLDETDVDCGGSCMANCPNGQGCVSLNDCESSFCNAAVCAACVSDGQCPADKYCDAGVCVADKGLGAQCTSTAQCPNNACIDGYCCTQSVCNGLCQSCGAMGGEGVCGPQTPGQPDDTCPIGQVCSAAGACKKMNGQPCAAAADCFSNFCVDGVCCNGTCIAPCRACNVSGSFGTCTFIPAGQDPANECAGAMTCNGAGVCQ